MANFRLLLSFKKTLKPPFSKVFNSDGCLFRTRTVFGKTRLFHIQGLAEMKFCRLQQLPAKVIIPICSYFPKHLIVCREFSVDKTDEDIETTFNLVEYEKIVEETLQSMSEFIDEVLETTDNLPDYDVSLSDGILRVFLGNELGTYVINKQTPNRQIWLSSPFSGPKRFDYIADEWIYKRTGVTLPALMSEEFSKVLERKIEFPQ